MSKPYACAVAATGLLLLAGSAALAGDSSDEATIASAQEVGKAFTTIARKAVPAVVFIQVERELEGSMQKCASSAAWARDTPRRRPSRR